MMQEQTKKIGFLGLGNMGMAMVLRLLEKGYEVHAWNRSPMPREEAKKAGAQVYESITDLVHSLERPRVIWSMVAAGPAVDEIIARLTDLNATSRLEEGDIFVDGVNSHYKDSIRRAHLLGRQGVTMLDCGVSGGIEGARNGACIMAGGEEKAYYQIEQLISDLSSPEGYGYFGKSGAGHFVKMVHNAIEYGMMQAIAEGMNLISASEYEVDYQKLSSVWNHGSIISGNLLNFLQQAFTQDARLEKIPEAIGSLGTGKWAVIDALDKQVPFSSIATAVFARYGSRGNNAFANKIISALRAQFGGHNEHERDVQ